MNKIFANTNSRKDFLRFELEKYGTKTDVYIAVAFFTHDKFIEDLVHNGCNVRLIVRLRFPTSARSLNKIFHLKNVFIRYYTANEFHPKLYIFGNDVAFVGSSNLTDSGLTVNQELNVSIDSEDPVFDELREIFEEYWNEAQILTQDKLDSYSQIISPLQESNLKIEREIEREIYAKLGKVVFPNIERYDRRTKSETSVFVEEFLKTYQLFLGKFKSLKEIYQSIGHRKAPESILPLRIEIDQFLSWIREEKAYGELYKTPPVKKGEPLHDDFVIHTIKDFLDSDVEYIDYVAKYCYPLIRTNFASERKIKSLTEEEIKETVWIINAFASRLRFYHGGKNTLLDVFVKDNGVDRIKDSINHLLFGKGKYTQRIAECIFEPKYKLKYFGESRVQETFGWANSEDIPLCNGRAFKSMQWLGFGRM